MKNTFDNKESIYDLSLMFLIQNRLQINQNQNL